MPVVATEIAFSVLPSERTYISDLDARVLKGRWLALLGNNESSETGF
jgi:hypothetical protein